MFHFDISGLNLIEKTLLHFFHGAAKVLAELSMAKIFLLGELFLS